MAVLWSFGYIFALIILAIPCEASISCTFDSGNCGWHVTSVSASGFRWTNTSGQTNDRTSGPLNDHTCKNYNGMYLYILGSKSDPNETAILDSEEVNLAESTQLSFWYSMHGLGIGKLSLLEISGNGTVTNELWSQSGRHGKDWKSVTVTVSPGTKYFRFAGTTRLPFSSDIAIDDVNLSSESLDYNLSYCSDTTTTHSTTSTTTTSTTHKPTPKTTRRPTTPGHSAANTTLPSEATVPPENVSYISLPWSCDFEDGICGLRIVPGHQNRQLTWNIGHHKNIYGSKNQVEGGHLTPQHTGQDYLKFNSPYNVWRPIVGSSEVTTGYMNESVLLSFWYNMPNKNSNLQVVVRTVVGNESLAWDRSASNDGARFGWFEANLTIDAATPFKVMFVTRNKAYPTRVGLDDISLSSAVSTIQPPTKTNSSTTLPSPSLPSASSSTSASSARPTSSLPTVPSKVSLLSSISGSKLTDKKPISSTAATVTKKGTEKPKKKLSTEDEVINNGEEKQTGSKYSLPSSTVGGLVAGLVGVVIIGLAIYFVRGRCHANKPLRGSESVSRQSKMNESNVVQGTSYVSNEPRATNALASVSVGKAKRFSSEVVHGKKNSNNSRKYTNGSTGHVNDALKIDVEP